jgi:hypothetical protein
VKVLIDKIDLSGRANKHALIFFPRPYFLRGAGKKRDTSGKDRKQWCEIWGTKKAIPPGEVGFSFTGSKRK